MSKIKFLLIAGFMLLTCMNLSAQSFTDWDWDTYGVKFSAPSNFKVQTNTAEEFTAKLSNDLLHLSIIPWKDASLTKETLKKSVRELCVELGYTAREIGTITDLDLNGYEGCYAMISKDGVSMIIEGLLDPASATNFYTIIVYGPGYEDKAIQVANSFSK
jgi:hypothetical protein